MEEIGEARAVLVIPAWNEEAAIGRTIAMAPAGLFREVLVVDNGSTDGTAEAARRAGARVIREPRRGYGAACLAALANLPAEGEVVVFLQADASEDPAEAARLIKPIVAGEADLVIGSRTLGMAEKGALEPHQRFGNWLAVTLIRWIWGYRYTDLGPFRAISRAALKRLRMEDGGYGWTIEMQVKALEEGLRVQEIPVSYRVRVGESKISGNLWASGKAGAKILYTLFRLAWRGRWKAS